MRAIRSAALVVLLILGVVTSSVAAPTVGAPAGYLRFALGGPEHEFADVHSSPSGWVMTGSRAGASGSEALVAAIDASGKVLWQQPVPGENALVSTVTSMGSIWVATIARRVDVADTPTATTTITPSPSPSPAPTASPTDATTTATPSATPTDAPTSGALDPDGVGVVDEIPAGRAGSELSLSMLSSDGAILTSLPAAMPDGWVAQPVALLPWKDGVLVVGTAISPSGAVTGFAMPVGPGTAPAPVLLGSGKTHFSDAVLGPNGTVLIAGTSSEALLGKAAIGSADAIVATFTGTKFTKVVRSSGGQRGWTAIVAMPTGYVVAGSALVSGRREAVVSAFTAAGAATWSKRFPGTIPAEEQRVVRIGTTLRVAMAAQTANATLYPGWAPKGTSDLLVLTLDATKGTTTKVTAIASAGREELVDAAGASTGGAVLLRSDGTLPGGTGSVILARLGSR